MNTNTGRQNIFFYLVGLSAITIYSVIIYRHAYNIPKWDDFPEVLQFMDRWLAATDASSKFSAFLFQNNEHILLVNHFFILLQYYLAGHLDFAWLIYIGNFFYIGSAVALWLFFRKHDQHACYFAVIMLCAVSFYSYDSTLWAMTAISNQAVIFFSFLAIYFASREKKNISLIMLLSTLATFSQLNGIMVVPVIGIYFFSTKDWASLKHWAVFTIILIFLYIDWFNPATPHEQSIGVVLHQLHLQNYLLVLPTFFACFGGSIFNTLTWASFLVSLITGLVICTITFIQLKQRAFEKSQLMLMGFLALSILSIAAYRGLLTGPQVAFVSRYKMYASYFLVTGVLLSPLLIAKLRTSLRWQIGVVSASAIYFSWSFPANLPHAKIIDNDLFESLQHWVEDGDLRRARGFFVKDVDSYLFAAIKNKTYNPIVLLPVENRINDITTLSSCPNHASPAATITSDLLISHKNPNAVGIKVTSLLGNNTPMTIILCSSEHFYQFELKPLTMANNESSYFIDRTEIAPGSYEVWLTHDEKNYRLEKPFLNKAAIR